MIRILHFIAGDRELPDEHELIALAPDHAVLVAEEDKIGVTQMEIGSLLMGGFLKGYRTQVLGLSAAVTAVAMYAVGDWSLMDLVHHAPEIIGGLGLAALGSKINTATKSLGGSVKSSDPVK